MTKASHACPQFAVDKFSAYHQIANINNNL